MSYYNRDNDRTKQISSNKKERVRSISPSRRDRRYKSPQNRKYGRSRSRSRSPQYRRDQSPRRRRSRSPQSRKERSPRRRSISPQKRKEKSPISASRKIEIKRPTSEDESKKLIDIKTESSFIVTKSTSITSGANSSICEVVGFPNLLAKASPIRNIIGISADALLEICTFSLLNNPNVLCSHKVELILTPNSTRGYAGKVLIFVPKANKGNLDQYLREIVKSHQNTKQILFQMALGIEAMHEKKIAHRDIKLDNFLVHTNDDNETLVMVSDFEKSKVCDDNEFKPSSEYPPYKSWNRAPEVWYRENNNTGSYGLPADIWALGCLMFEIVRGSTLFTRYTTTPHGKSSDDIYNMLKYRLTNTSINMVTKFSKDRTTKTLHSVIIEEDPIAWSTTYISHFIDLLRNMLNVDQSKRYTARQVANHAFFRGLVAKRDRNTLCAAHLKQRIDHNSVISEEMINKLNKMAKERELDDKVVKHCMSLMSRTYTPWIEWFKEQHPENLHMSKVFITTVMNLCNKMENGKYIKTDIADAQVLAESEIKILSIVQGQLV